MNNNVLSLLDNLFEEQIERYVLDNGLTVLLKQDFKSELISSQLWVKTGSIHEGDYTGSGISHYVEHMLFKGTKKRTYTQINKEIQGFGGSVNAYTSFDRTVYYINAPSEALGNSLDVLEDIVFHSEFPENEVKKEKQVIQREIDMGLDDPSYLLSRAMLEITYRKHPYRHPVIGRRELFDALKRKDLLDYYNKRYVPNNMTLVVVGAFDLEEIKKKIDLLFLKNKQKPLVPVVFEEEPIQVAPRTTYVYGEYNIVRGSLAYKIPSFRHPDSPLIDVFARLLGGGRSSLLWKELREEKRLVHSIDASSWNPGEQGLLCIDYVCDYEKFNLVESAIQDVLNKAIKNGFKKKDIEKVMTQNVVAEINNRKTVSGQASRLGFAESIIGDLEYSKIYFEKLKQVTPEKLKNIGKVYCDNSTLVTAVSLPEKCQDAAKSKEKVKVGFSDFKEIVLDNGVRLLLQEDTSSPKIHIKVVGLGGPMFEELDQAGLTTLMARMLTRDTKKYKTSEIAETIEALGASLSASTGNNTFGISSEFLSIHLAQGLDILDQCINAPAFLKETFDKEKSTQIASIKEDLDEITSYSSRLLRKTFFKKHPYSNFSSGTLESLENIKLKDIKDLYKRLVVGSNLVISVSGAFNEKEITAKLKTIFKKVSKGQVTHANKKFKPSKAKDVNKQLDRQQAIVYHAFPGIGVNDSSFYVSEVLDEMMSGMSSELFANVREKHGLAYFVGSGRVIGLDTGMFYLYAGTHADKQNKVLTEMAKEIQRLSKGKFNKDEINFAKTHLKASKRSSMQSSGSRALEAALNVLYKKPINDWKNYDAYIDAVSAKDLQTFVKNKLSEEHRIQVCVHP